MCRRTWATPTIPTDDVFFPCDPVGAHGSVERCERRWATGGSPGRSRFRTRTPSIGRSRCPSPTPAISSVQFRGVAIDDIVRCRPVKGSTSFEADADPFDGWAAPIPDPEGSADNPNTWDLRTFGAAVHRRRGVGARFVRPAAGDHQASRSQHLRRLPVLCSGRHRRRCRHLLRPREPDPSDLLTRSSSVDRRVTTSSSSTSSRTVVRRQPGCRRAGSTSGSTKGFATYAEWLWSEREGFGTAQENFDSLGGDSRRTTRSGPWRSAILDPIGCSTSPSMDGAR